MEDNFKIPSLDNKIKFIPRKQPVSVSVVEVEPVKSTCATDKKDAAEKIESESETKSSDSSSIDEQQQQPLENNQIQYSVSKPTASESIKPKAKQIQIKCSYMEPKWSKRPDPNHIYSFEILKNGIIVENIKNLQEQAYWLIGKLPENHIPMAHPTISRYHAVFQYRPEVIAPKNDETDDTEIKAAKPKSSDIEKGWYLYDLGSTHGSFVNKMKIPAKTYVRVRVGYMLRFGGSTRNFILQGPEFDEEAESELTITEMKEIKHKKALELIEKQKFQEEQREADGISWGMSEDADEETDLSVNPFAATNNEELFLDDPKKTLRGYFEREGFDLDYRVDEMSPGTFVCKIELPITDSNGRSIIAELCHKGKKKDCVLQAALEACRILDRHGVLRQANHEPRKRKIEKSDSDDDDDFYDRTGAVERKRQLKAASLQTNALSYAELLEQEKKLIENISKINLQIDEYQNRDRLAKKSSLSSTTNNTDDLDDFMTNLSKDKKLDKIEIRRMRVELQTLKSDHLRLQKLINIARPIDLPPLKLDDTCNADALSAKPKKLNLPLFGKRGGPFKFGNSTGSSVAKKTASVEATAVSSSSSSSTISKNDYKSDEEEIEEHDEEKTNIEIQSEMKSNETLPSTNLSNSNSHSSETKTIEETNEESLIKAAAKKKRNRVRIRGDRYRQNVDMDDSFEQEDVTKYCNWVPPENSQCDGSTNLNEKYGY